MPRHFVHSLLHLLRHSTMALLMMAALVNPILAAVGDLHDINIGAAHSYDADDHENGLAEGDESKDFLHALMHASHCCGHLTAIYNGAHVPDVVPARNGALPVHVERRFPRAFSDHFRPPIAA